MGRPRAGAGNPDAVALEKIQVEFLSTATLLNLFGGLDSITVEQVKQPAPGSCRW